MMPLNGWWVSLNAGDPAEVATICGNGVAVRLYGSPVAGSWGAVASGVGPSLVVVVDDELHRFGGFEPGKVVVAEVCGQSSSESGVLMHCDHKMRGISNPSGGALDDHGRWIRAKS